MNWRPIKTAPKDRQILLKYPSFSEGSESVVGMGCWVDMPHNNIVMEHCFTCPTNIPNQPHDPHWEIGYVAIMEHGGRWNGLSFEPRSCRVEPTHWRPLPKS